MEKVELPESELAEMKQFYQEEYDRTSRRLQHITNMLKNLGMEPGQTLLLDKPSSAADLKQRATLSTKPPAKTKRRKKTGRKSKWELLIMKRLRQLDKPVTYEELTDEIMTFAKLPENKRISTKQAVVNVIFRLRNRDKKLDTFSIGTKEKYIALKGWFEKPGEIKKEYRAKIELPDKKKRTGRSRKKAHS